MLTGVWDFNVYFIVALLVYETCRIQTNFGAFIYCFTKMSQRTPKKANYSLKYLKNTWN